MVYLKTFIFETEKAIIPSSIGDAENKNSIMMRSWEEKVSSNMYDIFKECDELKNREYLNVTNLKENLDPNLTYKGKNDFSVNFFLIYLFYPYTNFLYVTIKLDFNNYELVKGIFDDGIFDNFKYSQYICNSVIKFLNEKYTMKNEIVIKKKRVYKDVSIKYATDESINKEIITDYTYKDFISFYYFPYVVARQNIINDLINNVIRGYNSIKSDGNIDHNKLLFELKKKYIDFLNIDSESSMYNSDRKKSNDYDVLCKMLNIDSLNDEYQKLLVNYEDLVKTEVSQKNIVLADTLNTIQIASIVLTIVGWILVILQQDLPSRVPIYVLSIILCSFVSVMIAFIIKKIIDKK